MRELFSSLSVRVRVLVLISSVFAVVLGMTVNDNIGDGEDALIRGRTQVLGAAHALAAEQEQTIGQAHQALLSAALSPAVRRGVASDACNRALAAQHQRAGNLNSMLLALPDGKVICAAIPVAYPINLADRDFFKAAVETREFAIGGYVISRGTGKSGLAFALPVLDDAGIPKAVVATTVSLDWLEGISKIVGEVSVNVQ